jgi:hypothetical protein
LRFPLIVCISFKTYHTRAALILLVSTRKMFIYKVCLLLSGKVCKFLSYDFHSVHHIDGYWIWISSKHKNKQFPPHNRWCCLKRMFIYLMHLFIFYITEHFQSHWWYECELFLALFHLFVLLHEYCIRIFCFIFVPTSFYNLWTIY